MVLIPKGFPVLAILIVLVARGSFRALLPVFLSASATCPSPRASQSANPMAGGGLSQRRLQTHHKL